MPVHVQNTGCQEFGRGEALPVGVGLTDFVYQRVGDDFARLVVRGVELEYFGVHGPAFHDLGEEFHEVVLYVGTGQAFVLDVGEQAVQTVTELMEVGLHVVDG